MGKHFKFFVLQCPDHAVQQSGVLKTTATENHAAESAFSAYGITQIGKQADQGLVKFGSNF